MTIRKATTEETKEILTYSLQVLREATVNHVKPTAEKAAYMVSPILSEGGYYLVHVEDNIVQGWIGIGFMIDFNTDELVGVIPELYVLKKYRKRGIAEKLCIAACEQLQALGYKKIQLNVFAGNQARRLYQKLGFTEIYSMLELKL